MKIKVKIAGRYRNCELLRAYRSKATGELGFVDVRVLTQDQCGGIPAEWRYVPVAQVRKADRAPAAETLPVKVALSSTQHGQVTG